MSEGSSRLPAAEKEVDVSGEAEATRELNLSQDAPVDESRGESWQSPEP